ARRARGRTAGRTRTGVRPQPGSAARGSAFAPGERRQRDGRVRDALTRPGRQAPTRRVDPAVHPVDADVAVLDSLQKHLQPVGVLGTQRFGGLPRLVVVDRAADHVARPCRKLRGLIAGDLPLASGAGQAVGGGELVATFNTNPVVPYRVRPYRRAVQQIDKRLMNWASIIDADTLAQARATASLPFVYPHLALMPDAHLGKGATVGSVIPTLGAIIPAAVGVDIGCGMHAVRTQWTVDELRAAGDLHTLHGAISSAIPLSAGKY